MNKVNIFITAFFLLISTSLIAQTDFSLSGLGRVIVTHDKLEGEMFKDDTVTPKTGVGGYILFDLKPTLKVNNMLHANAILRVKNEFGSFFGEGTRFEFRQFQVMGSINDEIRYEIGDINIQMTPYTVFAFPEMYHQYEAEIFAMRRDIVNYENFVIGNNWRLQGVQGFAAYEFDKGIESLGINAFGVRTNPTNDVTIPDRILAGTRIVLKQSKFLTVGGNYVGLQDIPIESATVNYVNHVVTGDAKLTFDQDAFNLQLAGEAGFSDYDYEKIADKKSVGYNDFFYEFKLSALFKPAKLKFYAGYKDVGPQFSSPSAQTRRIDITRTPQMFPTFINTATSTIGNRNQVLVDRFTQENIYNRGINPVLFSYNPYFNVIYPYGDATPNRKGISAGIETDTSLKVLRADARLDLINEVIGEGVVETKSFTGVRGGFELNVGRIINSKKKFSIMGGARYESAKRDGSAAVDFKTMTIDAGVSLEVVKRLDFLVGAKLLSASGTEFIAVRDEFNNITGFGFYNNTDVKQSVYSAGLRLRFAENSYFTVNYNISPNEYTFQPEPNSYSLNQLFFHYTMLIP